MPSPGGAGCVCYRRGIRDRFVRSDFGPRDKGVRRQCGCGTRQPEPLRGRPGRPGGRRCARRCRGRLWRAPAPVARETQQALADAAPRGAAPRRVRYRVSRSLSHRARAMRVSVATEGLVCGASALRIPTYPISGFVTDRRNGVDGDSVSGVGRRVGAHDQAVAHSSGLEETPRTGFRIRRSTGWPEPTISVRWRPRSAKRG